MLKQLKYKLVSKLLESGEVNRSLARHKLSHARDIHTHMTRCEQDSLWRLATKVRADAVAIEIGSYLGASACFIGAGLAEGCKLYCVDTWRNETMSEGLLDTFDTFRNNVKPIFSRIHCLQMNSQDLHENVINETVDLVFIDGDHSYTAVSRDLRWATATLSESGVIALHDSVTHKGVGRAIGEHLATGNWGIGGHVDNLLWIHPII
jgi:predicted O-methyltransferase YrrM